LKSFNKSPQMSIYSILFDLFPLSSRHLVINSYWKWK